MLRLATVFDMHESEENAVSAFYFPTVRAEPPVPTGRSVLCLTYNGDVLACLRELLRGAAYDVHTSSRLGDARILMRVMHFDLLLLGPDVIASPATQDAIHTFKAGLPVIELGSEFSTRDAGEACAELLKRVEGRLKPKLA
jgi:hypothetical protein